MKYTLLVVLLSSGVYREDFHSAKDCFESLREFDIIAHEDLWTGVCTDQDGTALDFPRITTRIEP